MDHFQTRLSELHKDGYTVFRGAYPEASLRPWLAAITAWTQPRPTVVAGLASDKRVAQVEVDNQQLTYAVVDLHLHGDPQALATLGDPRIYDIVTAYLQGEALPGHANLMTRSKRDEVAIPWHRGPLVPEGHRALQTMIFLESWAQGEGSIELLPGSHRSGAEVNALRETLQAERHTRHLELEPGDILVSEPGLVWRSEAMQTATWRPAISVVWHAARTLSSHLHWSHQSVTSRQRLAGLGLRAFAQVFGGQPEAIAAAFDPPLANASEELIYIERYAPPRLSTQILFDPKLDL